MSKNTFFFNKFFIFYFILPSDEMIDNDAEDGDEAGNSSLGDGWSSSELKSYEEQRDPEYQSGVSRSFLCSNPQNQVCVQSV